MNSNNFNETSSFSDINQYVNTVIYKLMVKEGLDAVHNKYKQLFEISKKKDLTSIISHIIYDVISCEEHYLCLKEEIVEYLSDSNYTALIYEYNSFTEYINDRKKITCNKAIDLHLNYLMKGCSGDMPCTRDIHQRHNKYDKFKIDCVLKQPHPLFARFYKSNTAYMSSWLFLNLLIQESDNRFIGCFRDLDKKVISSNISSAFNNISDAIFNRFFKNTIR